MGLIGGVRGRRMGERVLRTARKAGLGPAEVEGVSRAYRIAMAPRDPDRGGLPSEDHPAYLHPGRTALILLEDVGERDPEVIAAGILAESRDLRLRVEPRDVEALGLAKAGVWWSALPAPDWGDARDSDRDLALLEALVVAPVPVQRIVLAEALDQVRHAHLWRSRAQRRRARELVEGVFGPLAPRVDPVLDRRFTWWRRRVAPGIERAAPPEGGGARSPL